MDVFPSILRQEPKIVITVTGSQELYKILSRSTAFRVNHREFIEGLVKTGDTRSGASVFGIISNRWLQKTLIEKPSTIVYPIEVDSTRNRAFVRDALSGETGFTFLHDLGQMISETLTSFTYSPVKDASDPVSIFKNEVIKYTEEIYKVLKLFFNGNEGPYNFVFVVKINYDSQLAATDTSVLDKYFQQVASAFTKYLLKCLRYKMADDNLLMEESSSSRIDKDVLNPKKNKIAFVEVLGKYDRRALGAIQEKVEKMAQEKIKEKIQQKKAAAKAIKHLTVEECIESSKISWKISIMNEQRNKREAVVVYIKKALEALFTIPVMGMMLESKLDILRATAETMFVRLCFASLHGSPQNSLKLLTEHHRWFLQQFKNSLFSRDATYEFKNLMWEGWIYSDVASILRDKDIRGRSSRDLFFNNRGKFYSQSLRCVRKRMRMAKQKRPIASPIRESSIHKEFFNEENPYVGIFNFGVFLRSEPTHTEQKKHRTKAKGRKAKPLVEQEAGFDPLLNEATGRNLEPDKNFQKWLEIENTRIDLLDESRILLEKIHGFFYKYLPRNVYYNSAILMDLCAVGLELGVPISQWVEKMDSAWVDFASKGMVEDSLASLLENGKDIAFVRLSLRLPTKFDRLVSCPPPKDGGEYPDSPKIVEFDKKFEFGTEIVGENVWVTARMLDDSFLGRKNLHGNIEFWFKDSKVPVKREFHSLEMGSGYEIPCGEFGILLGVTVTLERGEKYQVVIKSQKVHIKKQRPRKTTRYRTVIQEEFEISEEPDDSVVISGPDNDRIEVCRLSPVRLLFDEDGDRRITLHLGGLKRGQYSAYTKEGGVLEDEHSFSGKEFLMYLVVYKGPMKSGLRFAVKDAKTGETKNVFKDIAIVSPQIRFSVDVIDLLAGSWVSGWKNVKMSLDDVSKQRQENIFIKFSVSNVSEVSYPDTRVEYREHKEVSGRLDPGLEKRFFFRSIPDRNSKFRFYLGDGENPYEVPVDTWKINTAKSNVRATLRIPNILRVGQPTAVSIDILNEMNSRANVKFEVPNSDRWMVVGMRRGAVSLAAKERKTVELYVIPLRVGIQSPPRIWLVSERKKIVELKGSCIRILVE